MMIRTTDWSSLGKMSLLTEDQNWLFFVCVQKNNKIKISCAWKIYLMGPLVWLLTCRKPGVGRENTWEVWQQACCHCRETAFGWLVHSVTCKCTAGNVPVQRSEGGNAGVSDKRAAARTFGVAVRQPAWDWEWRAAVTRSCCDMGRPCEAGVWFVSDGRWELRTQQRASRPVSHMTCATHDLRTMTLAKQQSFAEHNRSAVCWCKTGSCRSICWIYLYQSIGKWSSIRKKWT